MYKNNESGTTHVAQVIDQVFPLFQQLTFFKITSQVSRNLFYFLTPLLRPEYLLYQNSCSFLTDPIISCA